ncbi:MAG: tetratricopeptide repeat protein [Polyangia bacterium]
MTRALPRLIVGALALSGCNENHPAPTTAAPPGMRDGAVAVSRPVRAVGEATPLSQAEFATNEGELALANLSSQLDGQEAVKQKSKSVDPDASLAMLHVLRAQMTGSVADLKEAQKLADELVKAKPKAALSWHAHALVMKALHRFDDATHDFDQAVKLGEAPNTLIRERMSMDQVRGRNEEAVFAYRKDEAKQFPTIENLGAYAIVLGDRGDIAGAKKSFAAAQAAYRDVSPFPFTTLYFNEGYLEQRSGSPARARELFSAAHERLPGNRQVIAHLASVLAVTGDKAKAIALLEPLVAVDDPEYEGQLAALLADTDKDRAAKLRADASMRYEALLKDMKLTYADHAARFYLSTNDPLDAKKALELAKANMANRPTLDAQRLTVDAAIAAGDSKLACATADLITKRRYVPPEAHVTASRAFSACGQKARADKEIAAMSAAAPSVTPSAAPAVDAGQ